MLILILLFAQVKTSHFERLSMPVANEWANFKQLDYTGDFTIPSTGKWTVEYQKLYPGDYTKIPVRCDFKDQTNKATPIYDIDESYDHITVQSKARHKIHWSCTMAVPKK